MSLHSLEFLIFAALFLGLFAVMSRALLSRVGLILVSSALFYAWWDWRFLPVMAVTLSADHAIARAIASSAAHGRKRALVAASVAMNVGVIVAFRYLQPYWLEGGTLTMAVPLAVSFYTLQSLSYTIDVYRGACEPAPGLGVYAASATFFPQLISGPIMRAGGWIPQIVRRPRLDPETVRQGTLLIAAGVFKKTLGDFLLEYYVSYSFDYASSTLDAWAAAIGFTTQLYCDFAGYTDIALGVATLAGFSLSKNFDLPFLATSPTDFWRRWHITLTSWFNDYVFEPLRSKTGQAIVGAVVTAGLFGIWHGLRLTLVAWAAYYLVLVGLEKPLARVARAVPVLGKRWLRVPVMLYVTVLGFAIFRSGTIEQAIKMVKMMHLPDLDKVNGHTYVWFAVVCAVLVVTHAVDWWVAKKPSKWVGFALAIVLVAVGIGLAHPLAYKWPAAAPAFYFYQF